MDKTQTVIIAAAVVAAAVIVAVALIVVSYRVHSVGTLKTLSLKAYSDQNCTVEAQAIDWGQLSPGETAESALYVKIAGNTPANLTMTAENWEPAAAANYITLSWDYAGQILQPNQVLKVKIQLHVSSQIQGITDFSNDIILTATEVKT